MILFEAKLSKNIQRNYELFDKTERLTLLEESVKTIMNMVPHNLSLWRRRLNGSEGLHFDFFQPMENLRGQSIANFFIQSPDMITNEIASLSENEGSMALSLVQEVCDGSFIQEQSLKEANWLRSAGEPIYDLHYNNLLNHAIADEKAVTSLKIIIEHILSVPTSTTLQRIVGSCIPKLLELDNDDYECMTDYFVSIDPEAGEG